MTGGKPHVSVCIPLYNGERYLRECLACVAGQTFGDFEVLLVDDGSQDATLEIAAAFAAQDRRVRLVRNERNLGLVGNWNRCFELARGEWIKYVFQDDLVHADCIEALVHAADEDALLVACGREIVFHETTQPNVRRMYLAHKAELQSLFGQGHLSAEAVQTFALQRFGLNPLGEPTAVMIRRRAFERYGTFNSVFVSSCDAEFWLRVGVNAGARIVARDLASYRVHGGTVSATNLSTRHYRTMSLENLVLLHEYVHSPHFAPLRARARAMDVDLKAKLRQKKHEARAIAEWANQPPQRDGAPLRELAAVTRAYPALHTGTLPHLVWRLRNRFALHRGQAAQARS